jgi:glycosyltransferase involved in cell wall biosynthesis
MPPFTALLHTENDSLRLGRTLEMLLPCSEILIVDHHSTDATRRIARAYGARIVPADIVAPDFVAPDRDRDRDKDEATNRYLDLAKHDWLFCMKPGESITEGLQATLFEWSALPGSGVAAGVAFSVFVRQQSGEHWLELPAPEARIVPRSWTRWRGRLPAQESSAVALEGELLRFDLP